MEQSRGNKKLLMDQLEQYRLHLYLNYGPFNPRGSHKVCIYDELESLLSKHGSVRVVLLSYHNCLCFACPEEDSSNGFPFKFELCPENFIAFIEPSWKDSNFVERSNNFT